MVLMYFPQRKLPESVHFAACPLCNTHFPGPPSPPRTYHPFAPCFFCCWPDYRNFICSCPPWSPPPGNCGVFFFLFLYPSGVLTALFPPQAPPCVWPARPMGAPPRLCGLLMFPLAPTFWITLCSLLLLIPFLINAQLTAAPGPGFSTVAFYCGQMSAHLFF